jgi:hypothetical protein
MSDKIVDLHAHRASIRLRDKHTIMLRCNRILGHAIEDMEKFANRRHILRTLYLTIADLEFSED